MLHAAHSASSARSSSSASAAAAAALQLQSWSKKLSRPTVALLALLLLQLLLSALWIGSIQREQHEVGGHLRPTGPALTSSLNAASPAAAECVCPSSEVTQRCAQRIEQSIMQLEQLKSEMHRTPITIAAPLPAVAIPPPPPLPTITPPPSLSAAVVANGSSGPALPLLLIAIPSMPRAADYLTGVLRALERQLSPLSSGSDSGGWGDPMAGQVVVWVMNNAPPGTAHEAFEANRARFKHRPEFRFLTNDHALADPTPHAPDSGFEAPNVRVRKQTRDIVALMRAAKSHSRFYMAMEDDFEACPNTIQIIEHLLRKASKLSEYTDDSADSQAGAVAATTTATAATATATTTTTAMGANREWITLKMGYGFNGLLLHNNRDLEEFGNYLLQHQARRPPVRQPDTQATGSRCAPVQSNCECRSPSRSCVLTAVNCSLSLSEWACRII